MTLLKYSIELNRICSSREAESNLEHEVQAKAGYDHLIPSIEALLVRI